MSVRTITIAVCLCIAGWIAYRGISCAVRSDRDMIAGVVATFAEAFAEGDARSILGSLTRDFEATYRRQSIARRELADTLRYLFLRGDRFILDGRISSLEIEPEGEKDRAVVEWEGEVRERGTARGGRAGTVHRGTATLSFRKEDGDWLLASAETHEE